MSAVFLLYLYVSMSNYSLLSPTYSLDTHALALTIGEWALCLRLKPLPDMTSVASMLARLAPEQPHIDSMIEILQFLDLRVLQLFPAKLIQRVQYRDWLEADCTRWELIQAKVAV